MAEAERIICRVDQLVDGGLAVKFELTLAEPPRTLQGFVIAFDGAHYAYINSCPHRGTELDWQPGEVFDESGLYLACATHGALFEPASGLCVGGPCHGDRLRPLPITVVGNDVVLTHQAAAVDNEKNET